MKIIIIPNHPLILKHVEDLHGGKNVLVGHGCELHESQ